MSGIAMWTSFFAAQVGAAAALSGLVIVAISINLARILSQPTLPGRAGEALVILVGSMILSSLMLMPGRPDLLGVASLIVAVAVWIGSVLILRTAYRTRASAPRGAFASRFVLSQLTILPMIAGALLLSIGNESGFYWLAASALLAVANAILTTWVLLIEILR